MDDRPIGVFDSGLGGLTTVKKLVEHLPSEDIIYLGDTGRVPYGSRSVDTIIKYAKQDAAFLAKQDIKAMIVACNTVCSTAFHILDSMYDIPIFEVISAPCELAANSTKNGKVGVIGTTATIRSDAYEAKLMEISPSLDVISVACPLFVPMVENDRTDDNDIAALTIASDYFADLRDYGIDTLVMGCTHYPLLIGVISKVLGQGVRLIDSGARTASFAANVLKEKGLLTSKQEKGRIKYYITDSIEDFVSRATRFMGEPVDGNVTQVVLD